MKRKRDRFVLSGPLQARHHFTQLDQMTQRVRRYDTRRRASDGAFAHLSQTTVDDPCGQTTRP